MIARHEGSDATADVWAKIAAPLPKGVISWRQDGRPVTRDGKFFARFVSYIDAQFVRERLDSVVPGEWNLSLELLPLATHPDSDGVFDTTPYAFKARLSILGVSRECVGQGKDYKQAATDAFKRAAVRFGIGHELYDMDMLWVQMDGDGKYAKPVEDPQAAYDRKHGRKSNGNGAAPTQAAPSIEHDASVADYTANADGATPGAVERAERPSVPADVPPCPKCGGKMWDNRLGKRNPKSPDFKCRDRSCDGVIWPPKPAKSRSNGKGWRPPAADAQPEQPAFVDEPEGPPVWGDPGEIPF